MQLAEQNRLLGNAGGEHTASPNSGKKTTKKPHILPALEDNTAHL